MPARLSAFVIWAAAAAGVVFWVLRLGATPIAAPPGATVATGVAGPRADLSRLLGAPPAAAVPVPAAESSRFKLLGVIAEGRPGASARTGVALLSVDGKLPRAYRLGAGIEGGLAVQSVTRRGVALGMPGAPASVVLELPPPPAPATGEPLRLSPDGRVVGGMTATGGPGARAAGSPGLPVPPGLPGLPSMGSLPPAGGPVPGMVPPTISPGAMSPPPPLTPELTAPDNR